MNTNSETFRNPSFRLAGLSEMFPSGFISLESWVDSIFGLSISLYYDDYEWLIYFANKVEQQKWGQTWTLGVFDKFRFCSESENLDICMWYTDGTPTAANIKRSTRAKLACGDVRLIDNIEEPQVGHYEMTLYLPSFCAIELELQNQRIDSEYPEESGPLKLDSRDFSSLSMISDRLDRLEKRLSKQQLFDKILKGCFLFLTSSLQSEKFPEDGICDEFMSYVLKDEEEESIDDGINNGGKSSESQSTAEEDSYVTSEEIPDDAYGDVASFEDEGSGGKKAEDSVSEDTYEDVNSSEREIAEDSALHEDIVESDVYEDVDSGDEMVSADFGALEEDETAAESVIKETTQSGEEIEQPISHSEDTEQTSKRSKKKRTKTKATSKLSTFSKLEDKEKELSSETGDVVETDIYIDVDSDNEMASADFGGVDEEKATGSVITEVTQSDEEIKQPSSHSEEHEEQSLRSKKKRTKTKSASKQSKITQLEDKRKNLSSKTRPSAKSVL